MFGIIALVEHATVQVSTIFVVKLKILELVLFYYSVHFVQCTSVTGAKQPHSMTLPPPCLTVCTVFFNFKASPLLLQTCLVSLWPDGSIFISSGLKTSLIDTLLFHGDEAYPHCGQRCWFSAVSSSWQTWALVGPEHPTVFPLIWAWQLAKVRAKVVMHQNDLYWCLQREITDSTQWWEVNRPRSCQVKRLCRNFSATY